MSMRRTTPQTSPAETLRSFPDFTDLPEEIGPDLAERTLILKVEPGQMLAAQGSPCEHFPVVLSGRARIFTMDEDGREITLYRLQPGDGCVLAAMCSLSDEPLPGSVVIEQAGEGLLVPAKVLQRWVENHRFWRSYVFSLVARQLGQVVAVTNELAFKRLDTRIASFLLKSSASAEGEIRATHHGIAMEVGTRREVVSRILKEFEHAGILSLGRGVVRVINRQAIVARADPAGLLASLPREKMFL